MLNHLQLRENDHAVPPSMGHRRQGHRPPGYTCIHRDEDIGGVYKVALQRGSSRRRANQFALFLDVNAIWRNLAAQFDDQVRRPSAVQYDVTDRFVRKDLEDTATLSK